MSTVEASSEWAVTVGGEPREVGAFNLEKTLRVLDAVQALAAASSTAEDAISEWVEGEVERVRLRRASASPDERERERGAVRQAVIAANPQRDGQDEDEWLAFVEAHVERMLAVAEPPTARRIIRLIPYVYREARAELVRLLAVAVAPNADLEAADARGEANQYLDELAAELRHHATLAETVSIVERLARRVRDEATDEALGEAVASCVEAFTSISSVMSGSRPPERNGSGASTPGLASRRSTASPS